MNIPYDKLIARLIALGIPALVLLVAIVTSGFVGAVAIVAALAVIGGPLGMLGGILALGLLVLIGQAVAEYGFETVFCSVLRGLKENGNTKDKILEKVDSYPISLELKLKLRLYVEKFWEEEKK